MTDLYSETHALYCSDSHPLYEVPTDEMAEDDLRHSAWVHRGYWNQQKQKTLDLSDLDRFVHKIEAQLMLVLSGAYIGLLPEHLATLFEAQGRLRRLPYTWANYACTMQIVTRSGAVPKVNQLFISILRAQYA